MAHLHEHDHHCESCSHEHHHEHSLKKRLWLIGITVVLLIAAVLIEKNLNLTTWQLLIIYLVPYLLIGHDTLHEALEGILHGDAFNEHFLMSVATIGALCIGFLPGAETEFPEAVFVMFFFQVGELFEGYAEGKSRASIAHLMNIRPDVAHVEDHGDRSRDSKQNHGPVPVILDVSPEEVRVGEVIVIRPGEKVPLDGVVIEGSTSLNTVALTGETLPRDVNEGDEIISGCVNLSGQTLWREYGLQDYPSGGECRGEQIEERGLYHAFRENLYASGGLPRPRSCTLPLHIIHYQLSIIN